MPKFSIKHLLAATALIAMGLGMLMYVPKAQGQDVDKLILLGSALIGAGLLTPFKRPIVGFLVGLVFPIVLVTVWFIFFGGMDPD